MRKIIKAVIFDLDGVIINSNPEIEKFWHRWAAKTQRQLTQEYFAEHVFGRKGVETLEALFNDLSNKVKDEIIFDAIQFDSQMSPEPIAGVVSFIQNLLQLKIPMGLVTSSHKKRAMLMLQKQHLHSCFNAWVTAEDVKKGKPDPEPYLAIANKLKEDPQNCLVFEDAISGVLSAKAAGMEVIGVNNEQYSDDLLKKGATAVITNYNDLIVENHLLQTKQDSLYTLKVF